ncbi:MAG: TerB family tellurite resistance protein [Bacteroidetes bacterium]|nr:TerB family tellurite resistance protein [Bacteroidota bacterium]
MKKLIVILIMCSMSFHLKAQSEEVQQLMLNIEKLAQFKKILKNMKEGYQIISKGYTAVKDISQGNFNLHKTFLDGLMQVSPVVKKYKRIADIISYQLRIAKEYKLAFNRFKEEKQFTAEEIDYVGKVYSNLFNESLKNLDELSMVITSGKLRMSDDERLQAIDKIYLAVEEEYSFLKDFTNNTNMLSLQRKSEQAQIEMSRRLYGLKK